MFEPIPELSPDLDWMLQSGQADQEMLVEALIQDYYSPVYRIAEALLGDPEAAQAAARDTFVSAMLNVYRYRSSTGVQAWLFRLALDACRRQLSGARAPAFHKNGSSRLALSAGAALQQAFNSLPEQLRLPILFQSLLGWSELEIAAVLRTDENSIRSRLDAALSTVQKKVQGISAFSPAAAGLNASLNRVLAERWPEPDVSQAQAAQLAAEVLRQAGRQGAFLKKFTYFKEILLIGVAILFVVGLLRGANTLIPEPDPTRPPRPTPRGTMVIAQGRSDLKVTPTPSPEVVSSEPAEKAFYIVRPGDTLDSIARQLDLSPEELRQANRIYPGSPTLQSGMALYIPFRLTPGVYPSPTPVTPAPQSESWIDALLVQEIEGWHSMHQTWHTVWADTHMIEYGPQGYIGPPRVRRMQIWVSQDQSLILGGLDNNYPDEIWLRTRGKVYLARTRSNLPLFFEASRERAIHSPYLEHLRILFYPAFQGLDEGAGSGIQILGRGRVAGREALKMEQQDSAGVRKAFFWLDAQTGFLLRYQQVDPQDLHTVLKEIVVNEVAYDIDFPQDLFDPQLPWRGGFASDYTGEPAPVGSNQPVWAPVTGREPLSLASAPAGFDPASSSLDFRFPANFNPRDARASVDLLAEDYFLGRLEFGNPWTMICDRSPDGQRIAFVSQPGRSARRDAFLRWFDLSPPVQVENLLRGVYITQFAFAPDSRRLAVFGFDGQFTVGGVFILDTETGKQRKLLTLNDAESFAWSPDGRSLAMVGVESSLRGQEVIVLQTDTGEITHRASLGPGGEPEGEPSGLPPPDWLIARWGVEFPVKMGGLESCVSPPQE